MFAATTTQRLVRAATDAGNPRRLEAIRELGRQAMSEEIIACLASVVRQCRQQPNGMAIAAAKALAQSADPRISAALAEFLDHESTYELQHYLVTVLSHPRHGIALMPIVAAALRELGATGHCHWLENLLTTIGTPEARNAWEEFRTASVAPVLRSALNRLKLEVIPDSAERELADIDTPQARQALATLRREMVWPVLHIAKTSESYDRVADAITKLKALKILSVPGSAEALQDFLSQPARPLTQWVHRQEHVESGALESWTERYERSTSDFGQRPAR
ncbi:hypothetical protein [Taklimakanibacter lacteus]|uniref:hypothetical protein n=1 Tax=Taklimakanibacter lacteus TaxID=2268456 RepID=UPI000E66C99C